MSTDLIQTIREVAEKVRRFKERGLGEENTKASLIEPILEALGWAIRDPDEVHREFKPTSKDSPVDYALALLKTPRLFVEAKGLGENLADRKWIVQVLLYATAAGVEWCILTDGDEYRFYNASAPVDAEEKLFCSVRLSTNSPEEAAATLSLISRDNMHGNILDDIWKAHYVDRRVKDSLRRMLETRDKGLVRLIQKRSSKLTPKQIMESLRRLDVRIESPPALTKNETKHQKSRVDPQTRAKLRAAGRKAAESRGVSLADVIAGGFLATPTRLFRKYKGQMLEATLLPDGQVEFRGTRYPSCSTAAENARALVVGKRMNTNGWDFWQYQDEKGKTCTLNYARKAFLAVKKAPK